jgi:hypothetical protein
MVRLKGNDKAADNYVKKLDEEEEKEPRTKLSTDVALVGEGEIRISTTDDPLHPGRIASVVAAGMQLSLPLQQYRTQIGTLQRGNTRGYTERGEINSSSPSRCGKRGCEWGQTGPTVLAGQTAECKWLKECYADGLVSFSHERSKSHGTAWSGIAR